MRHSQWHAALACLASLVAGRAVVPKTFPKDYPDDSDLLSFVTLPDIRPLRLNVTVLDQDSLSPGYFFVTPYQDLSKRSSPTHAWSPKQLGPHIYDSTGDLVWSGASMFPGATTHDFRLATLPDGSPGLSFILGMDLARKEYTLGGNFLVDASYNVTTSVKADRKAANMHEFHTLPDGKSALYITDKLVLDFDTMDTGYNGTLITTGFAEVDITTKDVLFEWWAADHLTIDETLTSPPPQGPVRRWDHAHLNSVDKTPGGDYIVSARHTDTIYRVSGTDGSIMWRLGGLRSSFQQDFNFSRQHNAMLLEETPTTTTLSFLNNGADIFEAVSYTSEALVVRLDHDTATALLLRSYRRPDSGLSQLRGNVQTLPNSNVLVAWSENGYMSEFKEDGTLVAETSFASHRFVSYRGYKLPWIGRPSTDDIVVKATAYGARYLTTVFHVSWNGATKVVSWRFWGSMSCTNDTAIPLEELGTTPRAGFETTFQFTASKTFPHVVAEALAADGSSLGRSSVVATIAHPGTSIECYSSSRDGSTTFPSAGSFARIGREYIQALLPDCDDIVPFLKVSLVVALVAFLARRYRLRKAQTSWMYKESQLSAGANV